MPATVVDRRERLVALHRRLRDVFDYLVAVLPLREADAGSQRFDELRTCFAETYRGLVEVDMERTTASVLPFREVVEVADFTGRPLQWFAESDAAMATRRVGRASNA